MSGMQDSAARGMRGGRSWARDLMGAIALVEGAIAQRVFVASGALELPLQNAFGDPLATEMGTDVAELARRCAQAAEAGERVTLVARASDLTAARNELAAIAGRRLGIVVHAVAEAPVPGVPASAAGLASALALDDLIWGMLLGAGASEAIDLALIARRAAEDSGCPFFVVHEGSHAHDVEPIAAPARELYDAFVGPARRTAPFAADVSGAEAPGADRAFAERVPFALASAMRELESLTGRHHDVIERSPMGDAGVALVAAGALGDSIIADVDRLRAAGNDVLAVRVVAWRPFPAPRLVKALGRALAVTVLERVDQPLASGAPLAVQLKAAFSDALTWAPDYPGIGRIPRIVSGIVAPEREVDSADLDAIVHNVMADERGKRAFLLGGDAAQALIPAAGSGPPGPMAGDAFVMRGIATRREVAAAAAELSAAVLASALGLRTRVAVRQLPDDEGGGVAFDLVAGRRRPRGTHAPLAVGAVAIAEPILLGRGNPLARLAPAGVLAMPSERRAADALWAEIPPWAKALVFDRGARVVGWSPPVAAESADAWLVASSFVGIALALAALDRALGLGERMLDGAVVEREVGEALRLGAAFHSREGASLADRGGRAARTVFEGLVEIPRATIDREDDGVHLGRLRPRG
jgi:pyruvate-ferredoxin/flavodoxin oxidoreductase